MHQGQAGRFAPWAKWPLLSRKRLSERLGHHPPELLDPARSADPAADFVALGAHVLILRLDVEIAVEVERRAIVVHARTDTAAIPQQEVDRPFVAKRGSDDLAGTDALRALFLFPADGPCPRPDHRHPENHFLLHHEASHRYRLHSRH